MGTTNSKKNAYGYCRYTTTDVILKKKDLNGKHFVVTGGGSGLGQECVRSLYNHNATVTVLTLFQREIDDTKIKILKQSPKDCKGKLNFFILDLSDQNQIKECVKKYENCEEIENKQIDCLINNAGVMMHHKKLTKDGFEFHIGVNYFGHFTLTMLMMKFINPETGRIVNLSSKGHNEFGAVIRFDDLDFKKYNDKFPFDHIQRAKAYGQSKLAVLLFSRELNRRLILSKKKIRSFSLHPGVCNTKLAKKDFWTNFYYLFGNVLLPYFKSVKQAAATTIFCATDERIESLSGKYIQDCGYLGEMSEFAKNDEHAKKLFNISEEKIGLKFPFTYEDKNIEKLEIEIPVEENTVKENPNIEKKEE